MNENNIMNKDKILQLVQENRIDTVIVYVNDNSNINRSRFVSIDHFLSKVIDAGLGLSSAVFSFDTKGELNNDIGNGYLGGFPSWIIKPDISTFSVVPYLNNTARVIGDLYYSPSVPAEIAPRNVLKKVISLYKDEGIIIKGAFEFEFFIFQKNCQSDINPIFGGKQCYSEVHESGMLEIFKDIMHNLSEIGAGPEIANTEYASGQLEVTNSPFYGVEIADMATYYKMSIKEIVKKRNLIASFMPKPKVDQSGSGAHLHISFYDTNGKNLFIDEKSPDGLSKLCHNFIAGQLEHGNSMCCLANPTVNSYKRLLEYSFAPATITWGYEHRGAMIRVPFSRNENTRIENKLPGSDTNPYITLATILAAGLDGIKNKMKPPEPCNGYTAYESKFDKLPNSLIAAVNELKKDTYFKSILGEEFIKQYISLREFEWNRYSKHISDWEIEEYLEQI
ncbi:glutamine synthetase family protein [Maledivibacter halophilus]|uniref:glutamine synthetase n=1 Tax=Maledivibacter halophilus TaxID=36842 RepID=A0A1T5MK43_9FIRM|nr:glutamine synthetase family protein [Maledivibacter halophilus]SKC88575.1 glutamine synthetase [Maledivibacter halophilus]